MSNAAADVLENALVDLTGSHLTVVPEPLRRRYRWFETRNAASLLAATNGAEFGDLLDVLTGFTLLTSDLVEAGGQQSQLAKRLNEGFRARGWREARVDTESSLILRLMPYGHERHATESTSKVRNRGYKVDNFKARVALDVEWNAKDGNLSRDLATYRALYELALIDAAVIVTRTFPDLRELAERLALEAGLSPEDARKRLGTSTTTNTDKLLPMLTRGDGGGCPVLVVAICSKTWEGDASTVQAGPVSADTWAEVQDILGGSVSSS